MSEQFVHFAYPVLLLVLSLFFIYRLKITRTREAGGGGFIYTGLILTFLYAVVKLVEQHPNFADWFLEGVYPVIVIAEFVILAAGLISLVVGTALYFGYWGDRVVILDSHLEKLRLLERLQEESRYPYPLPELLGRALSIILRTLDEKAGLIYLYDSTDKLFRLTAAHGLNEDEKGLLREYPYDRNIITESLEDAVPLASSDFRSFGGKAQLAFTGYHSLLVIPLISARTKQGSLVFFSRDKHHYSEEFISIIMPIAEWMSELINSTRLHAELKKVRNDLESSISQAGEFIDQLEKLIIALDGVESAASFSRRCRGLLGSEEVWLIGLEDNRLIIHGGTTERTVFSDNFKTALVNALTKGRPVVLNQEDSDKDGGKVVRRSSVLYPVGGDNDAILLRKTGGEMKMSDRDIKMFNIIAGFARMLLFNLRINKKNEAGFRGFETINSILRMKISRSEPLQDLKIFLAELAAVVSSEAIILLFERSGNHFMVSHSSYDYETISDITINVGEGGVGRTAALKLPEAVFGTVNVSRQINQYDEENRILMNKLIGEREYPVFCGNYPIVFENRVEYIISVLDFEEPPGGGREMHRLLAVLTGLLNLRMEIAFIRGPEKMAPSGKGRASMSALVTAGQPVILDLIASMCQSLECEVYTAANGSEAIKVFDSHRPDVVIVDLATKGGPQEVEISDLANQGLPAWDLASRIKMISPEIPLIAVTGWDTALDDGRIKDAGFDYILQKPFRLEQLAEIIARLDNSAK